MQFEGLLLVLHVLQLWEHAKQLPAVESRSYIFLNNVTRIKSIRTVHYASLFMFIPAKRAT